MSIGLIIAIAAAVVYALVAAIMVNKDDDGL